MKSVGLSLESYMILCDWTLVLLKDIKNIDISQAERHQGYYHRTYQIGLAVLPDPLLTYDPNLL